MSKLTDAQLHKNVVDELAFEPSLDAGKIAVAVKNGIVTLSGSVPYYFEKWAAESAVKRVHGVEGVAEELVVHFLPDLDYTDTDIAGAARHALDWDTVLSSKDVKVRVEGGWVTLEGQLEWQFQRQSAHDAVAHLRGVRGVNNLLTLKVHLSPADIHSKIEAAFKRTADLDASHVHVVVSGGNVTLSGKLPTWSERDAATRAAWNTPGVSTVSNQIVIGM